MSHNSTSLKQLLLFLQNFTWREYEAPSTTRCFVLCLCLNKYMAVLASDRSTQLIFLSPETIWTKSYGNRRLLKCLYISGKSIHKYGRLGLWLFDVFQTSALKLLYGFQQNFTGSKYLQMYNVPQPTGISFSYSLITTRLPWYLIDLLVFNFSATAARILTKC